MQDTERRPHALLDGRALPAASATACRASAPLSVTSSEYRSGASGVTFALLAGSGGFESTSDPCCGSRSSFGATSGLGARRASTTPISAWLIPLTSATSSAAFSSLSAGAMSTTALRFSLPSTTASNTTGNRRAARAARIRL